MLIPNNQKFKLLIGKVKQMTCVIINNKHIRCDRFGIQPLKSKETGNITLSPRRRVRIHGAAVVNRDWSEEAARRRGEDTGKNLRKLTKK